MGKIRRRIFVTMANLLRGGHFFGVKRFLLRCAGISVGTQSKIVGPVYIGTVASMTIGANSWIGHDCSVEGNGSVVVGDNVDIAPHCVFSTGGHSMGRSSRRAGAGESYSQFVGNGSWVGIRCTFVNEVHVGEGSVVAAGAVVTKDVPADVVVGGIPAKVIKQCGQ